MKTKTSKSEVNRHNLEPLTSEEIELAEQNHEIVIKFLRWKHLNPCDWYDVVVFGYLHAVQLWFRRPDLLKFDFNTVAWKNMFSAFTAELRKQERRIRTVSFYDPLPGFENLTLADTLTNEDLKYIYKYFRPDKKRIENDEN